MVIHFHAHLHVFSFCRISTMHQQTDPFKAVKVCFKQSQSECVSDRLGSDFWHVHHCHHAFSPRTQAKYVDDIPWHQWPCHTSMLKLLKRGKWTKMALGDSILSCSQSLLAALVQYWACSQFPLHSPSVSKYQNQFLKLPNSPIQCQPPDDFGPPPQNQGTSPRNLSSAPLHVAIAIP